MEKLKIDLLKINNDVGNHTILGYYKQYNTNTKIFEENINNKYKSYKKERNVRQHCNDYLATIYNNNKPIEAIKSSIVENN